ncbi:MAG: hypothetical protein RL701_405 [Pseudomonadota bacterium]
MGHHESPNAIASKLFRWTMLYAVVFIAAVRIIMSE